MGMLKEERENLEVAQRRYVEFARYLTKITAYILYASGVNNKSEERENAHDRSAPGCSSIRTNARKRLKNVFPSDTSRLNNRTAADNILNILSNFSFPIGFTLSFAALYLVQKPEDKVLEYRAVKLFRTETFFKRAFVRDNILCKVHFNVESTNLIISQRYFIAKNLYNFYFNTRLTFRCHIFRGRINA